MQLKQIKINKTNKFLMVRKCAVGGMKVGMRLGRCRHFLAQSTSMGQEFAM